MGPFQEMGPHSTPKCGPIAPGARGSNARSVPPAVPRRDIGAKWWATTPSPFPRRSPAGIQGLHPSRNPGDAGYGALGSQRGSKWHPGSYGFMPLASCHAAIPPQDIFYGAQ